MTPLGITLDRDVDDFSGAKSQNIDREDTSGYNSVYKDGGDSSLCNYTGRGWR